MEEPASYQEVMDSTEPTNDDAPSHPVEVRHKEQESRVRSVGYPSGRTRTSRRYYVVHHGEEAVLHEGRWTTPDSHHNTNAEAKARAFGFAHGWRERGMWLG